MDSPRAEPASTIPLPKRETSEAVENLRPLQEKHGFIPKTEFEVIAGRRGLLVRDVHAVTTFFPHYRLKPLAPVDVEVCDDMTCHLHGARQLPSGEPHNAH